MPPGRDFIADDCSLEGMSAGTSAGTDGCLSETGFAAPGLSDRGLSATDLSGPDFSVPGFSWQGLSPQVLPCPAGASAVAEYKGEFMAVRGVFVAVLGAYLVYALLNPEKF